MKLKPGSKLSQWIVCLAVIVGPGCDPEEGWGCHGGQSTDSKSSSTLSYATPQMRIWATVPMEPNLPTTNIGEVDHYSIYPALPTGLTLNVETGTISGTPSSTLPETSYAIAAFGVAGDSPETDVTIEVLEAVAPSDLSYTPDSVTGFWGSSLPPMVAQFTGVAQSFNVEPPLNPNLQLDQITGRITGGFFGPYGVTSYVVTVANPFGSAQAEIQIEVQPADQVSGLLVPSAGDRTLDVYGLRGNDYTPIDAEYLGGASAVSVAATKDGRFLYVAGSNGRLYGITRDRVSGICQPPLELEGTSAAYQLAITPDDAYLIAAFDFEVKRYAIQADGSLAEPTQAPGPFGPSAMRIAGADRLLVASSYPGTIWCYDTEPVLALRGPATTLGAELTVVQLQQYETGAGIGLAFAITTTYDMQTHVVSGQIRSLRLATDGEIASGQRAVDETDVVEHGGSLSDACLKSGNGLHLLVADADAGRLYDYEVNWQDGSLDVESLENLEVGGNPTRLLSVNSDNTLVLDGPAAEFGHYSRHFERDPFTLISRTRTRTFPLGLLALNGPRVNLSGETLFVASAENSTLRAARTDPGAPGQLLLSAQGPVATGSGPLDVVASQAGPYVYTADAAGATISAFHLDETTLDLALIENELLASGSQPCSLALTPGGSHLYALDATGSVVSLLVDPSDGSLAQTGSVAIAGALDGACLRMDPLARYVFVVQPALGRVTLLRLAQPFGQPTLASTLDGLAEPVDLLASIDGRFVSVLERGAARVRAFAIDALGGGLVATGMSMPTGVAPASLMQRRPFGIYEGNDQETLRVFDPQQLQLVPIERVLSTSEFHAGFDWATELLGGTHRLVPLSDWTNPDSGTFGTGLVGLSPAGLDQRLTLYRYEPPPGANGYVPSDSLLLGAGQHALATRTRSRLP